MNHNQLNRLPTPTIWQRFLFEFDRVLCGLMNRRGENYEEKSVLEPWCCCFGFYYFNGICNTRHSSAKVGRIL